jgi:hypothetical protein
MLMQYLLTEDEYKNLVEQPKAEEMNKAVNVLTRLRDALLLATNTRCVYVHMGPGRRIPHCDDCPIGMMIVESRFQNRELCPKADAWSQ